MQYKREGTPSSTLMLRQMTRNYGTTYAAQPRVPLSLKELTRLLKALSDVTRLRVVNLLRTRSLCVRELQEVLELTQPTVSRQLAILRAAELVRAERQGTTICYSLCRSPFLNYPLDRFLSEIVPFFPELAADKEKLLDFKGDCISYRAQDHEGARPGLA